MSVRVSVGAPAAENVTANEAWPPTNVTEAGSTAALSVQAMFAVPV